MVATVGVVALLSLLLSSSKRLRVKNRATSTRILRGPLSASPTTGDHETTSIHCDFCHASFDTRNALFRHLRADSVCRVEAGETQPLTKQRVALLFGYYGMGAASAGHALEEAFRATMIQELPNSNVEFLGSTQSTITNTRASILGIESDCPAAEDVLVVRLLAPKEAYQSNMNEIFKATNDCLNNTGVELHSCLPLSSKMTLHAEQSCTQHVFHYLIPLRWLPDVDALLAWYPMTSASTPPVLLRLKEYFRAAESLNSSKQVCVGRFHSFAFKIRRPWHNYVDPSRSSEASPSHEPVWRALDRARFHGFVESTTTPGDVYKVYEFSGDEFVQQQVRRLVGTVVAMMHGWLPPDFIETSTQRETIVETPLAPLNLLYRAGSRFHYQELYLGGGRVFDSENAYKRTDDTSKWMQTKLLAHADRDAENAWLEDLRLTTAPRIASQLEEDNITCELMNGHISASEEYSQAPIEYTRVLSILQDIVKLGQWPSTSTARSRVIRDTEKGSCGSFTVVNSELVQPTTTQRMPAANLLFPDLTEAVFELESLCAANAHIDLARDNAIPLPVSQKRQPSSHCAINCNAHFTPHVDSGSGDGQSRSMIVGLGGYSGGGLMVEGDAHDIRYRALEFDGWKLRHWTKAFIGQRFSLVWFTPERQQKKED